MSTDSRNSPLARTIAVPLRAQERTLDAFEDLATWETAPSDGVSLAIASGEGRAGRAMRLDFDFRGGAGYAVARRPLTLDLPENYRFSFWIRAAAPVIYQEAMGITGVTLPVDGGLMTGHFAMAADLTSGGA